MFALQVVEELDIIENVKLPDLRSGRPTGNKSRKDKQQKKNEEREEAKKLLLEKVKLENKDDKESIDALDEYMGTVGGHGATMGEQKLDSDFGRNADLEDLSDDEDWVAAGDTSLKSPRKKKFFLLLLILPWSTLLWHRCYYPHRSRDVLSPVCGIFCTGCPFLLP